MDGGPASYVRDRYPALLRRAVLLVGDRPTAEDLVQDTLAKLWQQMRSGPVDNPDAWVRRVMVNAAISGWRRRSTRDAARHLRSTSASPSDATHVVDEQDRVWRAILPASATAASGSGAALLRRPDRRRDLHHPRRHAGHGTEPDVQGAGQPAIAARGAGRSGSVNDQQLDELITLTLTRTADDVIAIHDPIPDIERRAARNRRKRTSLTWATLVAVAAVVAAVVIGLDLFAAPNNTSLRPPVASQDPTLAPPTTSETAPASEADALAQQIAEQPDLVRLFIAPMYLDDFTQCAVGEFGTSVDNTLVYAWVQCAAYSTGANADLLSGSTYAAVLTVESHGPRAILDDATFVLDGQADRIDRLFPPDVRAQALDSQSVTLVPDDAELLARARAATSPSNSLDGTWTVVGLVGPNGESVLPDAYQGKVTLTFDHGQLSGSTGCNDVFGTYVQTGRDLVFPAADLGSTLVGCGDEPPLVSRLLDVRHISGSGDVRRLHADNWMILVVLHRS